MGDYMREIKEFHEPGGYFVPRKKKAMTDSELQESLDILIEKGVTPEQYRQMWEKRAEGSADY